MTHYQHIIVEPLTGNIGAEIRGVNVAALTEESFAEVRQALAEYSVVCLHDQDITPEEQVAFTARFGKLRPSPHYEHKPGYDDVLVVKREAHRKDAAFGSFWHADETFFEVPCCVNTLHAVDVPPYGGDTVFASCAAAYDALSPGMKLLCDQLIVIHSAGPSHDRNRGPKAEVGMAQEDMRRQFVGNPNAEVEHPLVNVNRITGRKQLWSTGKTAIRFKDMTEEESEPLLRYLYNHIAHPMFTCRVRYRNGTLVMWENFATLHIALGDHWNFRRELNRVQVTGSPPAGPAMPEQVRAAA